MNRVTVERPYPPEYEWKVVPWWWPPRWFGYKWARERYAPANIGGGRDGPEYRTDKQLAHQAFRDAAMQYVNVGEQHTNEHYRE